MANTRTNTGKGKLDVDKDEVIGLGGLRSDFSEEDSSTLHPGRRSDKRGSLYTDQGSPSPTTGRKIPIVTGVKVKRVIINKVDLGSLEAFLGLNQAEKEKKLKGLIDFRVQSNEIIDLKTEYAIYCIESRDAIGLHFLERATEHGPEIIPLTFPSPEKPNQKDIFLAFAKEQILALQKLDPAMKILIIRPGNSTQMIDAYKAVCEEYGLRIQGDVVKAAEAESEAKKDPTGRVATLTTHLQKLRGDMEKASTLEEIDKVIEEARKADEDLKKKSNPLPEGIQANIEQLKKDLNKKQNELWKREPGTTPGSTSSRRKV